MCFVTFTRLDICLFVQVRSAENKLACGHAGRDTHGGSAGRGAGTEAVAVRRLFEGRGACQQNGEQRSARVSIIFSSTNDLNVRDSNPSRGDLATPSSMKCNTF